MFETRVVKPVEEACLRPTKTPWSEGHGQRNSSPLKALASVEFVIWYGVLVVYPEHVQALLPNVFVNVPGLFEVLQ